MCLINMSDAVINTAVAGSENKQANGRMESVPLHQTEKSCQK